MFCGLLQFHHLLRIFSTKCHAVEGLIYTGLSRSISKTPKHLSTTKSPLLQYEPENGAAPAETPPTPFGVDIASAVFLLVFRCSGVLRTFAISSYVAYISKKVSCTGGGDIYRSIKEHQQKPKAFCKLVKLGGVLKCVLEMFERMRFGCFTAL